LTAVRVSSHASSYEEQILLNGYPFLDGADSSDSNEARHIMESDELVTIGLHGNTVGSLRTTRPVLPGLFSIVFWVVARPKW